MFSVFCNTTLRPVGVNRRLCQKAMTMTWNDDNVSTGKCRLSGAKQLPAKASVVFSLAKDGLWCCRLRPFVPLFVPFGYCKGHLWGWFRRLKPCELTAETMRNVPFCARFCAFLLHTVPDDIVKRLIWSHLHLHTFPCVISARKFCFAK